MDTDKKGLAIIFHSGYFDRLYHGLSITLAALALGRDVKLFFTYWALGHLKKNESSTPKTVAEAKLHKDILDKNIKKGHIQKLPQLLAQAKKMGAKIYACTNSMGLLNISRDELVSEVDKSMGITTFLTDTSNDQILFI